MCLWRDAGKLHCLVGGLPILLCVLFYPITTRTTPLSAVTMMGSVFPEIFKS